MIIDTTCKVIENVDAMKKVAFYLKYRLTEKGYDVIDATVTEGRITVSGIAEYNAYHQMRGDLLELVGEGYLRRRQTSPWTLNHLCDYDTVTGNFFVVLTKWK